MMRYLEMGVAFFVSVGVLFVISVFHAAAVEVSRKPRLALVTETQPETAGEPEEPKLAAAA